MIKSKTVIPSSNIISDASSIITSNVKQVEFWRNVPLYIAVVSKPFLPSN